MSTTEIGQEGGRVQKPLSDRHGPSGPAQRRAPEQKSRPWYRRPPVLIFLAILIAVAIVGGVLWWLHARRYLSTDDAFIDVVAVHISPQIAGRIRHVAIDDNQPVKAGQLLVQIDPAQFRAALDEAQANEGSAQAKLAQAQAQESVARATLDQTRAEVDVAEANATNAKTNLERDQTLAANHVVSRQQLDNAIANARSTAAGLEAARKKAAAAEAQLLLVKSQIEAAQAEIAAAVAQVERARLDLSYTTIAAPGPGRIAKRSVAVGDYVQPGQTLMALVPSDVWVTANFKETMIGRIKPGEPVDITVDAYPGMTFHGHVDSIQSGSGAAFSLLPPENATGNYVKVVQRVPVKIVFDHPVAQKYLLGPGMSVVPTVKVE